MKNLLLKCLLLAFFILGIWSTNASSAAILGLDGGAVAVIIDDDKKAQYSFLLPDKYWNKDNTLVMPFTLSVYNEAKEELFSIKTMDINVKLPNLSQLESAYHLTIEIGDYTFSQQVGEL